MTIAVSGDSITYNDLSVQNTAATGFGFKNRIINGDMRIDQRNAGAAITPASSSYTVDRFNAEITSASALTFQQVTDAPAGFTTSLKITVAATAAISAGTNNNFMQQIEGFNLADLGWGTANAASVTLSFWIKSSITGTYSVHLRNIGDAFFYISAYTVNTANTWEYKTVNIPGPTVGTWNTTNSRGVLLGLISLGNGTTFEGTAGSWQAGVKCATAGSIDFVAQSSGATVFITGVQLEKGSTATAFDYRDYGRELIMCQRYFAKTYQQNVVPGATSQNGLGALATPNPVTNSYPILGTWRFPAVMRTTPTIVIYNPSTGVVNSFLGDSASFSPAATLSVGESGASYFGSNVSVGTSVFMSIHSTASAEL